MTYVCPIGLTLTQKPLNHIIELVMSNLKHIAMDTYVWELSSCDTLSTFLHAHTHVDTSMHTDTRYT